MKIYRLRFFSSNIASDAGKEIMRDSFRKGRKSILKNLLKYGGYTTAGLGIGGYNYIDSSISSYKGEI